DSRRGGTGARGRTLGGPTGMCLASRRRRRSRVPVAPLGLRRRERGPDRPSGSARGRRWGSPLDEGRGSRGRTAAAGGTCTSSGRTVPRGRREGGCPAPSSRALLRRPPVGRPKEPGAQHIGVVRVGRKTRTQNLFPCAGVSPLPP